MRPRGRAAFRAGAVGALVAPATLALAPGLASGAVVASSGPQYCTDGEGVTVVVDLRDLDPTAGVIVRCAEGPAGSGYTGFDALADAGISYVMPDRQPGLVCRLVGRPATGELLPVDGDEEYVERCVDTPPTAAYWSYWHAPEGGPWEYSSAGAGNRSVIPGGFEGWSFSLNHSESSAPAPRVPPDNPNAPYEDEDEDDGSSAGNGGGGGSGGAPTSPPPTTSAPASGSPGGGGPTSPPSTPTTTPPSTPASTAPSTPPSAPSTAPPPTSPGTAGPSEPGPSAGGGAGGDGDDPRPDGADEPAGTPKAANGEQAEPRAAGPDAAEGEDASPGFVLTGDVPDAAPADGSGPPVSTMVGAGVLAGLALVGGVLAWRRRVRVTTTP